MSFSQLEGTIFGLSCNGNQTIEWNIGHQLEDKWRLARNPPRGLRLNLNRNTARETKKPRDHDHNKKHHVTSSALGQLYHVIKRIRRRVCTEEADLHEHFQVRKVRKSIKNDLFVDMRRNTVTKQEHDLGTRPGKAAATASTALIMGQRLSGRSRINTC